MSGRAACVMLSKGPDIVETGRFLNNNILEKMDAHQSKKRSMLRRLSISAADWSGASAWDTHYDLSN